MSDILAPSGYEPNETLEDNDLMEVEQPTSGGIRRNKKALLSTLRDYFKKLPVFTANNLVQADGTGTLRTTNLSTTEVSNTVTRSQNNESAIGVLDQRVDGNDQDIIDVNNRVDGNDTDIGSLETRMNNTESATGTNATDIDNLENLVNQNVKTTATPTFVDVIITGLGAIKGIIQGILDKTPQSYKTTDDVVFNSVKCTLGREVTGHVEITSSAESVFFTEIDSFLSSLPLNKKIICSGEYSSSAYPTGITLAAILRFSATEYKIMGLTSNVPISEGITSTGVTNTNASISF